MRDSWKCGVYTALRLHGSNFSVGNTLRLECLNSREVGRTVKDLKTYPFPHSDTVGSESLENRPEALKARVQASSTYWLCGRMSEVSRAFAEEMKREVREERRDVHCVRASLSVHDFERVGGASGLEGFKRTAPSRPKCERPRRPVASGGVPSLTC